MKNLTKYTFILAIIFTALSTPKLYAQGLSLEHKIEETNTTSKKSRHQIGLSFSNFGNIGSLGNFKFMHKYELKENLFLRTTINRPGFGFRNVSGADSNIGSLNLGAALGIEKHIAISDKATFYYGAEFGTEWASSTNSTNHFRHKLVGLAGVSYKLSNRFTLFGEFNYGARLRSTGLVNGNTDFQLGSTSGFNLGILMSLGKGK